MSFLWRIAINQPSVLRMQYMYCLLFAFESCAVMIPCGMVKKTSLKLYQELLYLPDLKSLSTLLKSVAIRSSARNFRGFHFKFLTASALLATKRILLTSLEKILQRFWRTRCWLVVLLNNTDIAVCVCIYI